MRHKNIVVVLHNIRSVHNVGSIFRTADAAGVSRIFCAGITPTPLDRFGHPRADLAKVALGAERTVPWSAHRSTNTLIKALRREGYAIYAVEQDARSVRYDAPVLRRRAKICLILGDEVRGVPRATLALADRILELPMCGRKESLNVAVAFGVVAYALRGKE